MINTTDVLRHIESRLGMSHHILELSRINIMDIVKFETLPTFSNYFPYLTKIKLNSNNDKVPDHLGLFYLKSELNILGVSKLIPHEYDLYTPVSNNYYQDPFSRQLTADALSSVEQPILFEFIAPNIVEVHPKTILVNNLLVELKCVHPDHLATIPLSLRKEFLELAFYDVCMAIYPIRKNFSQLSTTFGDIEIMTEQLEAAEDKRNELLNKFRENVIKNPRRRKIFVY